MDNFDNLPKLLPSSASQLLQALTQLLTYPDKTQLLHDIWHPQKCPAQLLPWLAWSLSVDDWNDAWSEKNKRQVIADAFEVHRYKATPYALKKALDSLGIETQIQEWWQSEGAKRGTVIVHALVNQNLDTNEQGLLTKAMLEQVKRIVDTAKRAAVHVEVQLGIALKESFGTGLFSGAGIGLASKDGAFTGVHPDSISVNTGALIASKNGVAGVDKQAQFQGVTPEACAASIASTLASKTGVGSIDLLGQLCGITPEQTYGKAAAALAGKSGVAGCEHRANWLGIAPNSAAISQGISALVTRIQFNHLTLQGAT
ncbi:MULTISPECIES: phage tail protein I [Pseudoalteromonas]|uniref:Phage tail protein I n=1 Tax=Pseudoalteromonas amylolytica TaxID=1859457 RepID=A0A1S1MZR1_9GAMM|nr:MULTISPECIES: phage tail protein I [Pseudoalteromonas]OHU87836.1 phage tail protein I [Pseudoalteromonas sp. JW3]OHU91276.1 phage tail protein I [Pseudoalteromonas amylolytica]